jgi:flagellar biosynthesis/type III secretory pathway chaperone
MKSLQPSAVNKKDFIPQLRELLDSQIQLSTNFCNLLEAEKQALIDMNISTLVDLARKKERELVRLQRLDENIQIMIDRIISAGGRKASGPAKLNDILSFLNSNDKATVSEYHQKLSRIRTDISTANHINQRFAIDTLGYLNDAVSFICNGISSDTLYNTERQEQRGKSYPALVSREV